MSTDKAADVLVNIAPCVADIMDDKDVAGAIEKLADKSDSDITVGEIVSIAVKRVIPLALKKHRDELYAILVAMTDKELETIKKQSVMDTIKDAKACIDKDLLSFFSPATATEKPER